jgi:hypothetical protein
MCSRDPLLGFGSSLEDAQTPSRCIETLAFPAPRRSASPSVFSAAPPLRFLPLQRFPVQGSGMSWLSPQNSTACAFRFSQPLGAFIRPEPAGLVSCRIRSWGLPSRALFLSRSRTLFPAPFPSWRSNRLQGFAPRASPPLDSAV